MKTVRVKVVLTAVSLLLAAGLAGAVEVKVAAPDAGGTAKAAGDKTRAAASDVKAGAKGAAADTKASAAAVKDTAKGAAADTKAGAKAAAAAKLIDINTASEAELKAVPGIGDAYAAKIVAGRPYANKAQLKSRKILPGPVYEKTKDLIIAKQPKK